MLNQSSFWLTAGQQSLPRHYSCCSVQGRWSLGFILPALLSPQALRAAGWSVSLLDLAGVDHFDIIEKLSEDSYVLTQVILNMISRA